MPGDRERHEGDVHIFAVEVIGLEGGLLAQGRKAPSRLPVRHRPPVRTGVPTPSRDKMGVGCLKTRGGSPAHGELHDQTSVVNSGDIVLSSAEAGQYLATHIA